MNPEFPMRNTTLCYLEQDGKWLMLHRVTKKNDMNHDKWIYQKDPENTCFRDHTGKTISRRLSCPKGEFQMTNFNDFLNEQMKDPEFKAEWDALDPEFSVIEAMLKARKESGLTQKQLSERTGIAQTDISKLERGNANPSLRTLQRLAAGMGMKVKIEFVPASAK